MNRTIRVFATSDLITDQRVNRTAKSLSNAGFRVVVTGQKPKIKSVQSNKPYEVRYIRCMVSKGPLFYFLFNVRIALSLIFARYSAVYANDLDTLPGCWIASVIRFKPLIYDSHELFPEVPELIGNPVKKMVWRIVEYICVKKAKLVFTVSNGVADELNRRYGVKPIVVRNLPQKREMESIRNSRPTLIYQGALNVGRGIELAIDTMNYLSCYKLIIVGAGDIEVELRKRVINQKLFDRIEFTGRLEPSDLHRLTSTAWLGLSLEEDMGLNYRYALPNKVFDYIAAEVPILVSDLPEMRSVVDEYHVGIVAKNRDPKELALQISDFIEDKKLRETVEKNLQRASMELLWSNEEHKLVDPIKQLFG